MTFAAPIWLAFAAVLVLLSVSLLALGWRKRNTLLAQFAAARLLDTLTEKASLQRRLLKAGLIVASVGALALALARPQYGVDLLERKARGLDIVFVLDSSRRMLATDLRPNRLERAKLAMLDLIDRLESDRIGLVAFAGQAFLQTPPTLDYGAFRESLKATDPSFLSRGGSDLGQAIEEAAKAFPSENNVKVVILLTDGEDLGGQATTAARSAAAAGIQIFTIGIGTPAGDYLRVRNAAGSEEFVRDADGQPVRSQLDEPTLQEIAQLTGGSYTRLGSGSLNALYTSVLATLPREERESELQEVPRERFQWLLAAALIALMLEMLLRSRRPGAAQAAAILVTALLVSPQPAGASQEQSDNSFNQAHAALIEGDYAQAQQLYTEAMQQTEDRTLQRDALYNMGHATHQLGRKAYAQGDPQTALTEIRAAEALFSSALELDPGDASITQDLERLTKVREAIEQLLEQQQQQEQQDPQQTNEENPQSDPQQQQQPEQQETSEQTGENESGQQQADNQQNESGQQQGEPSGGGEASQPQENETTDESAAAESAPPESRPSQPARNQPGVGENQQNEQAESSDPAASAPEESGESTAPVPAVEEPTDGATEGAAGSAADTSARIPVDGMTLQEARDLLESLRGSEQILPFTQPAPGRGQPLQDW